MELYVAVIDAGRRSRYVKWGTVVLSVMTLLAYTWAECLLLGPCCRCVLGSVIAAAMLLDLPWGVTN
ncbi:hypothetical protein V8C86DRAFT_2795975 [Haematococcus lacustris]